MKLLMLILIGLPAAVQAQFYYSTNNDNSINITGYYGAGGAVVIPSTLFWYSVNLPVTSIGTNAFQGNGNLTSVTIGTNINYIGNYAFNTCYNMTNITIPNSVTNIGIFSFFGCRSLTSIAIPSSVSNIGLNAFGACYNLNAFTVDTNNLAYSSVNGVLFNTNQTLLIQCLTRKSGGYVIPNSVTSIADDAFYQCFNLTSISISTNISSIGAAVFAECNALTNITIPNSVTNMGDWAFYDCYKLSGILIGSNVTSIGTNEFYDCTNLSSVTIPNNVTNIGDMAFFLCNKLTNAIIGKSVNNIGDGAFYGTGLSSIIMPNSVVNIGNAAFYNCTNLISVTIPSSVTNIEASAFYSCSKLKSITIPDSVLSIGDNAFNYCNELSSLYFQGNAPSLGGSNVFSYDNHVTIYYLPSATGWDVTFGGFPTVLWNPQIQTSDASFGVQNEQFGFNITGTSNLVIVVVACTNLANPVWQPVQTNSLTGGSLYFSDPQWKNFPVRYYRFSSP